MKGQIGRLKEALNANLWLIPLLSFLLAVGLSRALAAFDEHLDTTRQAWFVYGGSPAGARQLLSTIAGSMITFIGMVFSSTIIVLQLASSQFSPRVMRSFFRDRIIQISLGTFIATFAFAILVLREIREAPSRPFVPGLSTYVAISLVWLSLGMFVIYIDHIGQRIRAKSIIERSASEIRASVRRLASSRPPASTFSRPIGAPRLIYADMHGSVGSIDADSLTRTAIRLDAQLEVVPIPGDFLCTGAPIVRMWCAHCVDEEDEKAIRAAVSVEPERTVREDPLFGFRQLVDIADKALSPGINDPTTAVQVLDQLHELLRYIATSDPRPNVYRDDRDVARVFVPRVTWQQYVDHALEEILLYGRHSLHVSRRLRTLVLDLEATVKPAYQPALAMYRWRIEASIDSGFESLADREAARRLPMATSLGSNGAPTTFISS